MIDESQNYPSFPRASAPAKITKLSVKTIETEAKTKTTSLSLFLRLTQFLATDAKHRLCSL